VFVLAHQAASEAKASDIRLASRTTSATETDSAVAEASRQVQLLVEQALGPRKKKYRDDGFTGVEAIGDVPNVDHRTLTWERTTSICKQPTVVDKYSPEDIVQGSLGDCYLLSALSVMAGRPDLLDKVIITKDTNQAVCVCAAFFRWCCFGRVPLSVGLQGVLAIQLFKNGKWVPVIIDDRFPVSSNSFYDYARDVVYSGSYDPSRDKFCAPAFACSRNHDELWVMMIEKAYAKYHGSYAAIEGGLVNLALVDLTGGSSELIKLDDPTVRQGVKSGQVWAKILRLAEAGHLLGAGSNAGSDRDVSPQGIVQGHAYAILQAVEDSDAHGRHCLLQVQGVKCVFCVRSVTWVCSHPSSGTHGLAWNGQDLGVTPTAAGRSV
jgi:Calpain family cysteine protease